MSDPQSTNAPVLNEGVFLDAVACAVGDRFPNASQWQRSETARAALGRYRRELSGASRPEAVEE